MTIDSGRSSIEPLLAKWEVEMDGEDLRHFIEELEAFFGDGCQSCERCWEHR